jgi:hypothetical protein
VPRVLKSLPQRLATAFLCAVLLLLASLLCAVAGALVGGCVGLVAAAAQDTATPLAHVPVGMLAGFKLGAGLGLVGTLFLSVLGSCDLPAGAPATKSPTDVARQR